MIKAIDNALLMINNCIRKVVVLAYNLVSKFLTSEADYCYFLTSDTNQFLKLSWHPRAESEIVKMQPHQVMLPFHNEDVAW